MASDFPGAFAALRDILSKHSDGMVVQSNTPTDFTVVTRALGPNGKPLWFGCVLLKKSAVTYHLMPLYFNPALEATIAPELLPRKQGKTCFNFQRPDPTLFVAIDELTRRAREQWERRGFLEGGPVAQERLDAALRAGGQDPQALAKLRKSKAKQAAARKSRAMRAKPGSQS